MPKAKSVALAAYVPVLHKGYLEFFKRYPKADIIYVFGQSILEREDYLRKDLRALSPKQQTEVLDGLNRFKRVEIIDLDDIVHLPERHDLIILPDEDVSRSAVSALPKDSYELTPVFLRWDRRSMNAQDPVNADRKVSTDEVDREVMELANTASRKASNIWRHVGAVLVKNGKVVAQESNRQMPTDFSSWIDGDPRGIGRKGVGIEMTTDMHAEAKLIANAARDGVALKDAKIYVTAFPCPNCAKLIVESGITKCYYSAGYAILDGEKLLKANNVELILVNVPQDKGHPEEWISYKKA